MPHAVIVGAGLAGSLLAVYLARMGWRVDVFERRPDPRAKGYAGGRSINLALSHRGFSGLAGVGLDDLVRRRDAIPLAGRVIHPASGPVGFQPYSSKPADAINSVSRGGLNLTLLQAAAQEPHVRLHFDHPCLDCEPEAPAATFDHHGQRLRVPCDLLLGADGAFSRLRLRLMQTDRFDYSQTYLAHGYKELHIPAAADCAVDPRLHDGYALDPRGLHIWPRGGAMMIALPNRDRTFTCTLFWPFSGPHSFAHLADPAAVLPFFQAHYPDAVPLMPTLQHDFAANPTSSLVTIRCWPWAHHGRTLILGDAAHAIVPFYGQGMNSAFEDCRDLAACLAEHPRDQAAALEQFAALRKPQADAIADMALDNFVEMRDKVGRPEFLHAKKVEQVLHAAHPSTLTPQYNLVSFSTVPYAEAQARGRVLAALVARVVEQVPPGPAPDDAWRARVLAAGEELLASDPSFAPLRQPIMA